MIPLLLAAGLFRKRSLLAVAVALLALDAALQMNEATSGWQNGLVAFGTRLMAGFCFGCALYKFRYAVPCHWAIAAAIGALLVLASLAGEPQWRYLVAVRELSVPPAAYLIVLLGMLPMPAVPFFSKGDYSYGIYLYAFPIQQTVTALMPRLNNEIFHFAISLVLTTAFAAFSWHCVEKPMLRLRRRFSFVANRREAAGSLLAIP